MNLTVIENSVIAKMPATLQEYVAAKFRKQIHTHTDMELETRIKNLVIKTLFESGVKDSGDAKVISFLRETLLKDLRHPKFAKLTFEEVELAMQKGVRQEYGIYMGVNIQTIHSWLKAFIASKDREIAIKDFYRRIEEQEYGKDDRNTKPNPEGQKRVAEMLKEIIKPIEVEERQVKLKGAPEKTTKDKFLQKCLVEFDELYMKSPVKSKVGRFVKHNGKNVDLTEYLELRLLEFTP